MENVANVEMLPVPIGIGFWEWQYWILATFDQLIGTRIGGKDMYFTETAEGVIVNVRAQPRSSRAGIDGLFGTDALKGRIRSAPVDGKANKELIEVLADAFGLPKSAVVFKGGETSKTKRLLLRGITAAQMQRF